MSQLADLTASPITLTIFGKSYAVYPLTVDDWGAFCREVQFRPWKNLKDDSGVDEATKKALLDECVRKDVGFMSLEFIDSLDTFWGMREIVFLSMSKKSDITREQLGSLGIQELSAICELATTISRIQPEDHATTEEKKTKVIAKLKTLQLLS